jgi:organic radical activating enzyme
MKWTNKGREFDELGAVFKKNDTLVLLGTKNENGALKAKLQFIGVPIETVSVLMGSKKSLFGKILLVLSSFNYCAIIKKVKHLNAGGGYILILNFPKIIANRVLPKLVQTGNYIENVTVFTVFDFMDRYINIFAVYAKNKLYSKHNNLVVTTVCNLNCKYCLNFTPYIKKMEHYGIAVLKKDIDTYFSYIDHLGWLHLSGGEPLLYPNFGDIMRYIYDNYRDKIDEISFSTNGSIVPSDELCAVIKECNVKVLIDNYTKSVPKTKPTFRLLVRKLKALCIPYFIDDKKYFFVEFPLSKYNKIDLSEEELIEKYDKCQWTYHGQPIWSGKVCNCNYTCYANVAQFLPELPDDYFNLNGFANTEQARKELMEFRLGYSSRGYSSLCRYCNGSGNINTFKSPAGEQATGKLKFDVNHPTYWEDIQK